MGSAFSKYLSENAIFTNVNLAAWFHHKQPITHVIDNPCLLRLNVKLCPMHVRSVGTSITSWISSCRSSLPTPLTWTVKGHCTWLATWWRTRGPSIRHSSLYHRIVHIPPYQGVCQQRGDRNWNTVAMSTTPLVFWPNHCKRWNTITSPTCCYMTRRGEYVNINSRLHFANMLFRDVPPVPRNYAFGVSRIEIDL